MKSRLGIAGVLFAMITLPAFADRASLLEGCSMIKNAKNRAVCFAEIAKLPAEPAAAKPESALPPAPPAEPPKKTAAEIEQEQIAALAKKYEGVTRAMTAIRSATDVGVTYHQYSPYVQQLATEVALVKQAANGAREEAVIPLLEQSVEAYRDAGTFWSACINFFADDRNRVTWSGGLPLGMTGMKWVASKYSVPTQKADFWGLDQGISQSVGLTTIWQRAMEFSDRANDTLKAKAAPAPAS